MFKSLSLAGLLGVSFVAACASSEAAPEPQAPVAKSSSTDPQSTCVEVMTRNRTCTDQYIPALVDLRAKHDKPAGIAEAVKTDRAGVIAKAMEEWKTDSTDAAIASMCSQMAPSVSPEEVAEVRACLAQTDCAAYTTCVMPSFEKRFTK